jgi:hypothetical protein
MAGKAVEFSFPCDSSEKQPVEQAAWSNRRKAFNDEARMTNDERMSKPE